MSPRLLLLALRHNTLLILTFSISALWLWRIGENKRYMEFLTFTRQDRKIFYYQGTKYKEENIIEREGVTNEENEENNLAFRFAVGYGVFYVNSYREDMYSKKSFCIAVDLNFASEESGKKKSRSTQRIRIDIKSNKYK